MLFVSLSVAISRAFIAYFLYFLQVIFVLYSFLILCPFSRRLSHSLSLSLFCERRFAWKDDSFSISLTYSIPLYSISFSFSSYKKQSAKWARHHYMFNGMRLFVWPKKMEIRFALSQSVTLTFIHSQPYSESLPFPVSTQRLTANGKCNAIRKLLKWLESVEEKKTANR